MGCDVSILKGYAEWAVMCRRWMAHPTFKWYDAWVAKWRSWMVNPFSIHRPCNASFKKPQPPAITRAPVGRGRLVSKGMPNQLWSDVRWMADPIFKGHSEWNGSLNRRSYFERVCRMGCGVMFVEWQILLLTGNTGAGRLSTTKSCRKKIIPPN